MAGERDAGGGQVQAAVSFSGCHVLGERGASDQTPPDLVVKFQPVDIVDIIFA